MSTLQTDPHSSLILRPYTVQHVEDDRRESGIQRVKYIMYQASRLNFKHLRYFWMVARNGGVVKAARLLHVTPQTLSGQIKSFEQRLGCALLKRAGRDVELTSAGERAAEYADKIFRLGADLENDLRAFSTPAIEPPLVIGISDTVPKIVAYRLLEPAISACPQTRIVCREGSVTTLLNGLADRQYDVLIADSPAAEKTETRAAYRRIGWTQLSVYAAPDLCIDQMNAFPACLQTTPMLMPGAASGLKVKLDNWFDRKGITPVVIGEFDDGALMMTFGQEGQGAFIAPTVLEERLMRERGLRVLGRLDDVVHEFFAISNQHDDEHRLVTYLLSGTAKELWPAL